MGILEVDDLREGVKDRYKEGDREETVVGAYEREGRRG